MNRRILFFIKLPPPLTGATLMNQYVANSKPIQEKFSIKKIAVSYKREISDKHKFSLSKVFTIIALHCRLLKNLIIFRPKIVYFQISPLGIAFIRDCTYVFWLKLFRRHVVFHLHGKGIKQASENSKLMNWLYRWAFKGSSIICLSNMLVDDIAGVYSGVPYIVNNGIPLENNILEKRLGKESDSIKILFLSNLLYSKGIIVFLDALALLKPSCQKKIIVQIVGKEAELSRVGLNEEIKKRDIQGFVEYVGPKYGDDKALMYQTTNILVYPTLNDVWGLVILEAMQFGIPVIASREGAIPEIVDDGNTGFLVDKNNPEQIAQKLKELIENPELLELLGARGRDRFLNNYTIDNFERNIVNVFEAICSKS